MRHKCNRSIHLPSQRSVGPRTRNENLLSSLSPVSLSLLAHGCFLTVSVKKEKGEKNEEEEGAHLRLTLPVPGIQGPCLLGHD